MRFKVYGPYTIGVEKHHDRWIDEEDINSLCEEIYRRDGLHLSKACGVYLFGMRDEQGKRRKAGRTLPWYVGKAEKQSFKGEGFSLPKLYHYNSILINKYRGRGTPILFLLARVEEDDTHSLPAKGKSYWGVQFVEEMFIKKSLRANPDLLNKSKTETSRKTSIRGLLNTTRYKSSSVDELKGVFGISLEPAEVVKYKETKFRYEVDGPHEIPMKDPKTIDAERVEEMWGKLERTKIGKARNPLSAACGVYVIGMRNGNNTTPWYVGTAYNKSFKDKCFQSDSEREKVVRKSGTPVIFFFPRLTEKKGNFETAKPKLMGEKPKDMDYVQQVLLEYGVQTNGDILFEDFRYTSRIEILRDLHVEGFVKSKQGRKTGAVNALKSLLEQ